MSAIYPDVTKPVIFNVSSVVNLQLDNFLRRFCIVSEGHTNLTVGDHKIVDNLSIKSILKTTEEVNELTKATNGYFTYSGNRSVVILEVGSISEDNTIQKQAEYLQTFINNGLDRCYMYLCPSSWYVASSPLVAIAQQYANDTAARYFMINVPTNEDPTASAIWTQFDNLKSMFCVYDNTDVSTPTISLAGSILGLMASIKFDISDSNKASPLNYKTLTGYKFKSIPRTLLSSLVQAPCNFIFDEVGLPTLGNGRYTNGSTWEYWYQWDLTQLALQQKITDLLVSGVNNPQYVVRFDQQGIDVINAAVKSVLAGQIALGCVTAFGIAVNPVNNVLIGQGNINAMDFATYRENFLSDYELGVYKGINFFILIGRYIRQCILNITLD